MKGNAQIPLQVKAGGKKKHTKGRGLEAGECGSVSECLPMEETPGFPALYKAQTRYRGTAHRTSTWEVEAGGSRVQGDQLQAQSFSGQPGYETPPQKESQGVPSTKYF